MDTLTDVVKVGRARGRVLAHVQAHEPWGLDLAPLNGAAFHAVTAGSVRLEVEGDRRLRRLTAGPYELTGPYELGIQSSHRCGLGLAVRPPEPWGVHACNALYTIDVSRNLRREWLQPGD